MLFEAGTVTLYQRSAEAAAQLGVPIPESVAAVAEPVISVHESALSVTRVASAGLLLAGGVCEKEVV